jgi:hypothetical protein
LDHGLKCWKCGVSLEDYTLPLRRIEECRSCRAELHVCRMCEFHDVSVAKHCRETIADEVKDKERANFCDYFRPADEVKDKERANFCDYFRPSPSAYRPGDLSAADRARAELEALFGARK